MSRFIIEPFPHLKIITASAGTGKTYILSKRITQFLLSDIKLNDLRNILAITFTVNASKEMKERVINWLKSLAIYNNDTFKKLGIPEEDRELFAKKAEIIVDRILTNYKDFQIKTIDSFLASIFKASAIEFGYPQDFEVVLNNREYLLRAFDGYLNEINEKDTDFFDVIEFINENEPSFNFTPYNKIFDNIKSLYVKEKHHLQSFSNEKKDEEWQKILNELKEIADEIVSLIDEHSIKINGNCGLKGMLEDIKNNDFYNFFCRGDKTEPILKADKNKPWADELLELWEKLKEKRVKAIEIYSERFYFPYVTVLRNFEKKIEKVKLQEEVIFIEDIPSVILNNIYSDFIPDIYLRLGGRLYHYFIDEFQDTSPIQWKNLSILIDESLSKGGSLFIVGDTKQAIYGFRDTDYTIMKELSIKDNNPFPSIPTDNYFVEPINTNYRSGENILLYAKEVFDQARTKYNDYSASGLFDWDVEVDEKLKGKGYVKAKIIAKENNDEEEVPQEKEYLFSIIEDLRTRNFSFSDIAILAHKNEQIVDISTWLNEKDYPFLSYSSLDIRKRKVVEEIITLLKFLDSPKDNQSFAFFLLGEIFDALNLSINTADFIFKNNKIPHLYKAFQREYPKYWDEYFAEPFKYVGYLPIYELLCFIINKFKVIENFANESGAIAKLLEIVKDLELKSKNSLKEFLDFLDTKEENEYESGKIFELPIPKNTNAIKLMTVHKAKGLGFPVIIYFLYSGKDKVESIKIAETENGLKVLKINKNLKKGKLEEIYEKIEEKTKIDDLNAIYVGLTRAMEELYLIGVTKKDNEGNIKKDFPIDLIIEKEMGEKVTRERQILIEKPEVEIEIRLNKRLNISEAKFGKIAYEEKRRGEYIHLILSKIIDIKDINEKVIDNIAKECNVYFPEFSANVIAQSIKDFIFAENIKPFFNPEGNAVFVEKSFVDLYGKSIRVARITLKHDEVVIVDFKTGEREEDYKKQLEEYANVAKEIFNKKVTCYILYFDKREVDKVYEC